MMDANLKSYYDYTVSPLGQVFYRTVWHQLGNPKGQAILDFGSGFGFTSNYLAKENRLTAVEPNSSMIELAEKTNGYKQVNADISALYDMSDESFDIIICHLVFEFADNVKQIMQQLLRLLKKDGTFSIVRHNRNGRIIQAVVQDNDIEEAKRLLKGEYSFSETFGDIRYYEDIDLLELSDNRLEIKQTYGVRALASLHDNETRNKNGWVESMSELEQVLTTREEFINTSYFKHLLLGIK